MEDETVSICLCVTRVVVKGLLFGTFALACAVPALGAAGTQAARRTHPASVILDSTVTLLLDPEEPLPIAEAARDLAGDLEQVLGKRPKIVERKEDAAPVTILIGYRSKWLEGMRPTGLTGPESFSISATTANWRPLEPTQVVLLAGADVRGTIFAIYEFA